MSGICGIVSFAGPATGSVDKMAARAPWRGEGQTFGAREAQFCEQAQPRREHSEPIVVAADMRLDNAVELTRSLSHGRTDLPATATVHDLVTAAYRKWGSQFPQHLIGDFAIALWDGEARTLLLARDPMAVRPLYYFARGAGVRFASEIPQLLADPDVPRRISERAVAAHLAQLAGPLDRTFYEGIRQVAPGTTVVVSGQGVQTDRFYSIDPTNLSDATDDELTDEFRSVFERAVADRLSARGVHGSFLSGGFDSGAAAATAGRLIAEGHPAGRFLTYSFASVQFPDLDERHISDLICEAYGLPNQAIALEAAYPLSDYPEAGPPVDEPFIGHYQALYEATLRAAAAEGVTQMWSANRGDLMTGGSIYGGLPRSGWLQAVRRQATTTDRGLWSILVTRVLKPMIYRVSPAPRRMAGRIRDRGNPHWMGARLVDLLRSSEIRSASDPGATMGDLGRQQRLEEIFNRWQMRVATWTDRTQARFGMGWLDPWSDRRVVELVLAAEPRLVNTPTEFKRLTRRAMVGIMPEEALTGAVKTNMLPFYEAAVTGPGAPAVAELLHNSRVAEAGWVDRSVLEQAASRPLAALGAEDLWQVLTLEMWLRHHW